MRITANKRTGFAVLGLALLLGAAFHGLKSKSPQVSPASGQATSTAAPAGGGLPSATIKKKEVAPTIDEDLAGLDLHDVLTAEVADARVAAELIRRLPDHHGEGRQYFITSHIANVVDDEDYAMIEDVILNQELESSALDVLLADLNMRVEEVKLPTFARISENPDHPAFDEAFTSLRTYFDDAGDDLAAWQIAAINYTGPPPFEP